MTSPATPRLYQGLRSAAAAALRVFYRTIEITGQHHIEGDGPTILASNHPNSIIDPLLLGIFERRPVSFCARDGLFSVPGFGRILKSAGAIPIRRPRDHSAAGGADNTEAFAACRATLEAGGVISIFPEGKTHDRLRVEPLRTGVARIALDAEHHSAGRLRVRVVPVGLNYLVRHRFRSDIHVAFGPPIYVYQEFGELYQNDPRAAVRALTDSIERALHDLAVHVDRQEDERLIAQVTAIVSRLRSREGLDGDGQSPAERTALVRRIIDAYRWVAEVDPDRTRDLRQRLIDYVEARERHGVGDDAASLQDRYERSVWRLEGKAHRAFLWLGAPLAAFGVVNSAVPYFATKLSIRLMRARTDRIALVKLVGGVALFGTAYAAQTMTISLLLGPGAGALYAGLLLPSGFFARWYFTEARLHRLNRRSLLELWTRGDGFAHLKRERVYLEGQIAELRTLYLRHVDTLEVGPTEIDLEAMAGVPSTST